MLFLLNKTRYGVLARLIVGAAILAFGIVDHSRVGTVLGALVLAWGVFWLVMALRARGKDEVR